MEGHENSPGSAKSTRYDYVLPKLAQIEDDDSIDGMLVLLNTSGGDVDAGLAIAEMIASMSIPVVSLVLGGQPFHWRTIGRILLLFLYCPSGADDGSSGAYDGHGDRHRAGL